MDAAIYPDQQGAMRWWTGAGWTDQIMWQTAVAQEPKKKRGVLKWLPLALLLVAASCGALIEAGSEDTAPTPASMSSDTSTDTDPEPSVTHLRGRRKSPRPRLLVHWHQDSVWRETRSATATTAKRHKASSASSACASKCRQGPDQLSDNNQALYDTKGREYSPDDEAWIHLDTDPYAEINPGNRLKTVVPFDIPKRAKPDHLLLKAGFLGCLRGGSGGAVTRQRPIGPYSLYWQCRIQGADAYRAGQKLDACPYDNNRGFSGRAWRDGWRAAAKAAGVNLPHEMAAI